MIGDFRGAWSGGFIGGGSGIGGGSMGGVGSGGTGGRGGGTSGSRIGALSGSAPWYVVIFISLSRIVINRGYPKNSNSYAIPRRQKPRQPRGRLLIEVADYLPAWA